MRRYRWWNRTLCSVRRSSTTSIADAERPGAHPAAEHHWSNQDIRVIVIAFRVAYATMPVISGA